MKPNSTPDKICWGEARLAAVFVAAVAVSYALLTNHMWEDYLITLRSSRNLVDGFGLVFQPGERIHTFTSPVGVLLPALTFWICGHSVAAGLWLFRIISIAALAVAAALTNDMAKRLGWPLLSRLLVTALIAFDAKTIDFTINGMETAFFILGLVLYVRAHTLTDGRTGRHALGAAAALLQWVRPDGFIYVLAVTAAFLLFSKAQRLSASRVGLLRLYVQAAALATVLYAPWLIWAWWYYGTPVPHTIIAKGLGHSAPYWGDLVRVVALHPLLGWASSTLDAIYMPHYLAQFGGRPIIFRWFARSLVWVASAAWLWPRARFETRALSLGFYLACFYVESIPFLFPWYLPAPALLATLTCGAVSADVSAWVAAHFPRQRYLITAAASLCALFTATLLVLSAWQMRAHQHIIETKMHAIGEWLHGHARTPIDTVFLEPLGYVGYYSNLKMLDDIGLASTEVIAARQHVGDDWGKLVHTLQPDWLVLRPWEAENIRQSEPALLDNNYELVQSFDATAELQATPMLFGTAFLQFDGVHLIYRHKSRPWSASASDAREFLPKSPRAPTSP